MGLFYRYEQPSKPVRYLPFKKDRGKMNHYLDIAYDLLLYSLIALCFMSAGYFVICQAIDGIELNYLYHIAGLTAIGIVLSFVLVYFKSR